VTPRNLTIAYGIATSLVGTAVIMAVAGGIAECVVAHRLACIERGEATSSWSFFWNAMVCGRLWEGGSK
jgi:hypothetical protein